MIYLFVLFIIVFPFFIRGIVNDNTYNISSTYDKQNNIFLIFDFIVLFILGSIRYNVGTDYLNYVNNQFPLIIAKVPVNINFLSVKLIQFGYFLGHGFSNYPYQIVFSIFQFIILIFVFKWIKNDSLNKGYSVALIILSSYFSYSLSAMRQSMAISIMLYATKYIKNKNLIKYAICLVIAYLIHSSVIIYVFFYLLSYIKPKLGTLITVQILLFFIYPYGRSILLFLIDKTGLYERYIGSQFDTGLVSIPISLLIVVTSLVVIVSYFFFIDKSFRKEFDYLLWFDIFLLMVIPVADIFPTVTRMLYMVFPINIVLLPNIIFRIRNKYLKIGLYAGTGIVFCVFFYYFLFVNNGYQTLPYQTVFGNN